MVGTEFNFVFIFCSAYFLILQWVPAQFLEVFRSSKLPDWELMCENFWTLFSAIKRAVGLGSVFFYLLLMTEKNVSY